MEEKFFTSTSNFFRWVQEVAYKGGIKILTLGTHDDTYWVKYEVKSIAAQPDVIKSVCEKEFTASGDYSMKAIENKWKKK